jgi:hypothetical protein
MQRGSWAWRWVGAALIAACGGDPFVLASAAPDGASRDAGSREGGLPDGAPQDGTTDPAPMNGNLLCGSVACDITASCCAGANATPNCTHGTCGACSTVLACASDANCPGRQPHCCARSVANTACSGGLYYVATCNIACGTSEMRLCDPTAPSCPAGRPCSTDNGSLQNVGLPANVGYGVCK